MVVSREKIGAGFAGRDKRPVSGATGIHVERAACVPCVTCKLLCAAPERLGAPHGHVNHGAFIFSDVGFNSNVLRGHRDLASFRYARDCVSSTVIHYAAKCSPPCTPLSIGDNRKLPQSDYCKPMLPIYTPNPCKYRAKQAAPIVKVLPKVARGFNWDDGGIVPRLEAESPHPGPTLDPTTSPPIYYTPNCSI